MSSAVAGEVGSEPHGQLEVQSGDEFQSPMSSSGGYEVIEDAPPKHRMIARCLAAGMSFSGMAQVTGYCERHTAEICRHPVIEQHARILRETKDEDDLALAEIMDGILRKAVVLHSDLLDEAIENPRFPKDEKRKLVTMSYDHDPKARYIKRKEVRAAPGHFDGKAISSMKDRTEAIDAQFTVVRNPERVSAPTQVTEKPKEEQGNVETKSEE